MQHAAGKEKQQHIYAFRAREQMFLYFAWGGGADVLLKGLSSLDFCIPWILMGKDESYVEHSSGHAPNPVLSAADLCVFAWT